MKKLLFIFGSIVCILTKSLAAGKALECKWMNGRNYALMGERDWDRGTGIAGLRARSSGARSLGAWDWDLNITR